MSDIYEQYCLPTSYRARRLAYPMYGRSCFEIVEEQDPAVCRCPPDFGEIEGVLCSLRSEKKNHDFSRHHFAFARLQQRLQHPSAATAHLNVKASITVHLLPSS